jgi:proline dehydrogenase
MRSLLLWCAQNPWLSEHVPQWGFVKRAVKRFMPGEDFDAAQTAAVAFKSERIGAVFTKLGENIKAMSEATAAVEHYEHVLKTAAEADLEPEISVKPTQVGLDIDPEATFANLNRLAAAAAHAKGFLWIDMEGSAYTDRTLDLYNRVHARHPNVGVCLQAYLYRTASDAYRMLAYKPAIRLVKGAYAEPPDRAFPAKRDVDANFLALCALVLPDANRGRLRLVIATHDVALIDRVARFADAIGMDRHQLEVHMLYGIQTAQQTRLAAEGYRVKVLVAYGDAWYAWYLRRLAERPANVMFVARQMFG